MHPCALMRISGFEIIYDDSPSAAIIQEKKLGPGMFRNKSLPSLAPIGPSGTPIGPGEWLFHTLCYYFPGNLEHLCLSIGVLPDLNILACLEYSAHFSDHIRILYGYHDFKA